MERFIPTTKNVNGASIAFFVDLSHSKPAYESIHAIGPFHNDVDSWFFSPDSSHNVPPQSLGTEPQMNYAVAQFSVHL